MHTSAGSVPQCCGSRCQAMCTAASDSTWYQLTPQLEAQLQRRSDRYAQIVQQVNEAADTQSSAYKALQQEMLLLQPVAGAISDYAALKHEVRTCHVGHLCIQSRMQCFALQHTCCSIFHVTAITILRCCACQMQNARGAGVRSDLIASRQRP